MSDRNLINYFNIQIERDTRIIMNVIFPGYYFTTSKIIYY